MTGKKHISSWVRLFAFFALFCCAAGSFAQDSTETDSTELILETAPDLPPVSPQQEAMVDSLIREAVTHLGTRYRSGGMGEKGFDCSGFVCTIFSQYGYSLPHTSGGIALRGKAVKKADIRPGDVIYFKGSNAKSKRVGHVGIVVQNDGFTITFIHASVSKGICFDDLDAEYYRRRYLGTRRIW